MKTKMLALGYNFGIDKSETDDYKFYTVSVNTDTDDRPFRITIRIYNDSDKEGVNLCTPWENQMIKYLTVRN